MMVYGRAYFKGKVLSEFTDIGFSNVDEVIERLASGLPTDIPEAALSSSASPTVIPREKQCMNEPKEKGF